MLLTAYADVDSLLEAINSTGLPVRRQAWDNRDLATVVRRAMETYRLRAHNVA
jgi:hypothetical protein